MIDELDAENQTLLKQLKDVRDAAVVAAERAAADAAAAAAAAVEAAAVPESPDEPPSAETERAMAAQSLQAIEAEFSRVAKAGLRPHAPVKQTDIEPLARATAAVAAEVRAFASATVVSQVRERGVRNWPSESRDDDVATKLRQVAFGLRPEPAVVFGDLGAPLYARASPSVSGRPVGVAADEELEFI